MSTRVAPQDPLIERLRSATSITSLVRYLHDELNWPVDLDAIDDAFYDYEPEELGIKPEHQVAIKSIKQLRPLTSGQPWGIFFVEFDKQRLPMVVLRRVLQGLSLRNREKDKGRQRWHAQDLLFISSFGPASDREIALAHFTDESDKGDLPTLRVLGWDGADTNLALAGVANTMREHLRWPSDGDTVQGQQRWRQRWSSAFRLRYREAVTTAKDLALALAYLARAIRTRANEVLVVEGPSGPLTLLFQAFKANLMADLTHDRFADMYAQTITYGLFAARVSRSSGGLVADDAALMIPSTNPFLQDLLQDFLAASGRSRVKGRARGTGIDFDELGVNAVVEQLRQAPMDAVLVSFNNARPGDDPVIHFYEDFLTAYDKAMRVERGVFYTPKPVVQFIVRSVHEVLQNEFGIEDGLASTITWGEMLRRKPGLELPTGTTADSAFVQMLDPAVGTATFLVEIIDLIHRHMLAKWQRAGQSKAQQLESWNTYVRDHLLTRMHGFELMMAPYAIAHMKLGLKLADTGYRFPEGGPRVRVFLTNSLQPATDVQPQFELMAPMLAHEARAANAVKDHLSATVLIGNPPYSGVSANMFPWIDGLLRGRLPDGSVVQSYYEVDGRPLGERKLWLQDDYVKFMRFAQWRIEKSGTGVLGYITNHGYIDNPTFRGMRQALMRTFPSIRVTDLHGNSKKRERAPDGGSEENVFDIEQGVAICVMATSGVGEVLHSHLYGTREAKYAALSSPLPVSRLEVASPFYFFAPLGVVDRRAYDAFWSVTAICPTYGLGFQSSRDDLVVAFDRQALLEKIEAFLDPRADDRETRRRFFGEKKVADYESGDTRQWALPEARAALRSSDWRKSVTKCLYRPFDTRAVLYRTDMVDWPRPEVLGHMRRPNLALLVNRQTKDDFAVLCTRFLTERKIAARYDASSTFPLWLYDSGLGSVEPPSLSPGRKKADRIPNLSPQFVRALLGAISLDSSSWQPDEDSAPVNAGRVFGYIYAVLHSLLYRKTFESLLRVDFPRIPIPGSKALFDELAALGDELIKWHLLEHPEAVAITSTEQSKGAVVPLFFGTDKALTQAGAKGRGLDAEETTIQGTCGEVRINATSGFSGVLESVWLRTVGGYQVLHKWLDDRRKAGRSLSDEDIGHWRRIYSALQATQGLMQHVDDVIERHGGWPVGNGSGGAFSLDHPAPSPEVLAAQAAARPRGRRRHAQPGQQSFADADEESEPAKRRTTEKPKPKAAHPGGSAPAFDLDDGLAMCALRAVLGDSEAGLSRDALIRQAARALGHQRVGKTIATAVDDAIRRAVRRGIAENRGGELGLLVHDIDGYDRDHLKVQLISALRAQRGWVDRTEVPKVLARWLGYARTGAKIAEATESLVRALARSGQLELSADRIRVAKA